MAQYLNRKFTILQFLSNNIDIANLISLNKIKTIYNFDNGIIKTWQYDSSFNDFSTLEKFKTYYIINKNIEPENFILHDNENEDAPQEIVVNSAVQIAPYISLCPIIPINYFQDKIKIIYGINIDGLTIDTWRATSKFNTLNHLSNNMAYIIYSNSASLPYNFSPNPLYSNVKNILLDIKCDSSEYISYLSPPEVEDKCSSDFLSDYLKGCISNIVKT